MENVNARLLHELAVEWNVALCGPRGSRKHATAASVVSESSISPLLMFLVSNCLKSVWLALRVKPRIVLAGSGLTLPIAWLVAKLTRARLGSYLHGLDIIAPNRVYQLFWPRFIKSCDLILVNSRSTAALAAAKGAAVSRIHILHPGTHFPELNAASRDRFRLFLGLSSEPLLLSVGRLTRRKGLAEFVALALPSILKSHPLTKLIVVGEEAINALTATGGSERHRILAAARAAGTEHAVRFIGKLSQGELGDAYQAADLHVFPVLQMAGDIEGFGMVALESAAHGLRTVAFEVGGIPDSVEDGVTGLLVRPRDYLRFAEAVSAFLHAEKGSVEECRKFAAAKSWDLFGERVRTLVRAELSHG